MGRMPPDFLFMANKRPPKKNGVASFGQRPAKTTLVKPVRVAENLCLIHDMASYIFEMLGTHASWSTRGTGWER